MVYAFCLISFVSLSRGILRFPEISAAFRFHTPLLARSNRNFVSSVQLRELR